MEFSKQNKNSRNELTRPVMGTIFLVSVQYRVKSDGKKQGMSPPLSKMKYPPPPRTFKNIVAIVKILELHTENGTRRSKMTLLKNRWGHRYYKGLGACYCLIGQSRARELRHRIIKVTTTGFRKLYFLSYFYPRAQVSRVM